MDALIKLLDANLECTSHKIIGDTIYIHIELNKIEACCPDCNTPSERIHSRYTRAFQDLPISGKKTVLILNNRKFFCDSEDCNRKAFAEKFDFIGHKAKKTKRLETEIINLSKNMNSISASKLLRKNVATVSKSTVCNIFLKRIQILDKDKIKKVCIDDFTIKKRDKYATVMIDIETRKIVDILESRDYEEVKRWSRTFLNLELISRDDSIVYNKAIKNAHPRSIQVSDRFHILKNLTDYCKQYIKRIFKNKIEIGKLENINSEETLHLKEKYKFKTKWDLILKVKELRDLKYKINYIASILDMSNKTVISYSKISKNI